MSRERLRPDLTAKASYLETGRHKGIGQRVKYPWQGGKTSSFRRPGGDDIVSQRETPKSGKTGVNGDR